MKSALIALLCAPLLLAAPASKSWDNLAQLHSGDQIEVHTASAAAKGAFVSNTTESVTLRDVSGERRFLRPDVLRVVSHARSHRMRNVLIGLGAGVAIAVITDQTAGAYLRNESNPSGARALIWTLPIAGGAGIGAAIPSYRVVYQK